MSLAKYIDHTLLQPDCRRADIIQLCKEAIDHQFCAVCIPPYFVKLASEELEKSPVKVATVIGFPLGYSTTSAKVEEIKRALIDGVDELDVVINLAAVKSGDWSLVETDIDSATRMVHMKGKIIKLIIEASLLNDEELLKLCEICTKIGVNFVKTSTGYFGGATPEVVKTLRENLPNSIKIKASGGIRSKSDAITLIEQGADRLGSSAGIKIVTD